MLPTVSLRSAAVAVFASGAVACEGIVGIAAFGPLPPDDAGHGSEAAPPPHDAAKDTSARDAGAGDVGPVPIGHVGTLGTPCSEPGATACNGNDSQLTLICQNGAWASGGAPCLTTQRCDSTVGGCAAVVPACSGLSPLETFCGDASVIQCGVDLVTTTTLQTCGAQQACAIPDGGTATCLCHDDPLCTVGGPTCGDAAVRTCLPDTNGCFVSMVTTPCTHGACYVGDGGGMCCVNADGCNAVGSGCAAGQPVDCFVGMLGCLESSPITVDGGCM